MKIAVCVKRVPDSEARIKIGADGKGIDESGIKFILNPYDEYAVEQALKLKEAAGDGEVVVVSLGTAAVQETIRAALAIALDITPDSALAFQTENLSLTRLDHVAGPGEGGDWRIVTVNTLPT